MANNNFWYLEHSVVNQLIRIEHKELESFKSFIKSINQHLLISSEHFNEIRRCEKQETREKILQTLDYLAVGFIEQNDNSKFNLLDNPTIDHPIAVQSKYEQSCPTEADNTEIPGNDFMQSIMFLSQTGKGREKMESDLSKFINEYHTFFPNQIKQIIENMQSQNYLESLKVIEDHQGIKNFVAVQSGMESKKINYAPVDTIIDDILTTIAKSNPEWNTKTGREVLDLMIAFSVENNVCIDNISSRFSTLYSIIDQFYYPDRRIKKPTQLDGKTSDAIHAGLGLFCKVFLTADERQAKKAQLIYRYLDRPTIVNLFRIKDGKITYHAIDEETK